MTPEERTTVLAAIFTYQRNDRLINPRRTPGISICPTSWLNDRVARHSSEAVIQVNWDKLPLEEQLGIWLAAPDSDYEYVRDHTHVMKGRTVNNSPLKTSFLATTAAARPARGRVARPPVVVESGDPKRPITIGEGRAKIKRRKLTTVEFKDARAQAVTITGYDSTSPIYGKQLPEVINLIEQAIANGDTSTASQLLNQLKARALTRKLIGQAAQS